MQVQSTMGTVELAEVRQAGAAGPLMMFQLYVFKERGFVKQLIQREMYACISNCKLACHSLATFAFERGMLMPLSQRPGYAASSPVQTSARHAWSLAWPFMAG